MRLHPSAHRLLDALLQLQQVDGHSEPGKVASLLGESPATVTNWKARGVSKAGALKAAELFGVNPVWIRSGEGRMTLQSNIPNVGDVEDHSSNILFVGHNKRVPRLRWSEVQRYVSGMLTLSEDRYEVVASRTVTARCFMVEIDGDAMVSQVQAESIPPTSLLICDPDRQAVHGDIVVALHPRTQEAMARRLVIEAGVWYLKASNSAYPMLEVTPQAVIARAVEVITRRTL